MTPFVHPSVVSNRELLSQDSTFFPSKHDKKKTRENNPTTIIIVVSDRSQGSVRSARVPSQVYNVSNVAALEVEMLWEVSLGRRGRFENKENRSKGSLVSSLVFRPKDSLLFYFLHDILHCVSFSGVLVSMTPMHECLMYFSHEKREDDKRLS